MHACDLKPKAGDPLHEPGKSSRVEHFSAEGGRVRACGDRAVIELCAQGSVCLAGESDLVCAWSHAITPHSRWLMCRQRACRPRVRRHPLAGDAGVESAITTPRGTPALGWLERPRSSAFPCGHAVNTARIVLAHPEVIFFPSRRPGFVPLPDGEARAGALGRPGAVAQATVVAEPGPRSPRFPSSKFRAPEACAAAGAPVTAARPAGPGENRSASPWWWARQGRGRPCSSPTGWPPTRSGHRPG